MNEIMKRVNSKTYRYGAAVVVLGLAEQYGGVLSQAVPAEYQGLVVSLIGVGVWILREMTKTPVSDK